MLQVVPWRDGLVTWGFFEAVHAWSFGADAPVHLDTGYRAGAGLRVLPRGEQVLTGERDGVLRLWNLAEARPLATWRARDAARPIRMGLAVDGSRALVCTVSGEVALLRLPSMEEITSFDTGTPCAAVEFLGEQALVVLTNGAWMRLDAQGEVLERSQLAGVTQTPMTTVSPLGVIAGHDGPRVTVFDAITLEPRLQLEGHSGVVEPSSYSPDGARIATASNDEAIVWDAATGALLARLSGSTGPIKRARWSPDGDTVATASLDGTVRLWRTLFADGDPLRTPDGDPVVQVATDSSGLTLGLRDAADRCHFAEGEARWVLDGCADVLAVAGRVAAWIGADGRAHLTHESRRLADYALPGRLFEHTLSNSPHEWSVATADGTVASFTGPDFQTRTVRGGGRDLTMMRMAPGLGRAILASAESPPAIEELATGTRIAELPAALRSVYIPSQFDATSTGREAAVASPEGDILRFSLDDGRALPPLRDGASRALFVLYSPDGSRLAATAYDRVLRVYSPADGSVVLRAGPFPGLLQGGRFSPDGSRFALDTDQGTTRVYEVETGRLLRTIQGSFTRGRDLQFMADGRLARPGTDGRWVAWSLDATLPPPHALTNYRVCRADLSLVAVVPFPTSPSAWAAECEESRGR